MIRLTKIDSLLGVVGPALIDPGDLSTVSEERSRVDIPTLLVFKNGNMMCVKESVDEVERMINAATSKPDNRA